MCPGLTHRLGFGLFRVSVVTSFYHRSGISHFLPGEWRGTCNCISFRDLQSICLNIFTIFEKVPYFVI